VQLEVQLPLVVVELSARRVVLQPAIARPGQPRLRLPVIARLGQPPIPVIARPEQRHPLLARISALLQQVMRARAGRSQELAAQAGELLNLTRPFGLAP